MKSPLLTQPQVCQRLACTPRHVQRLTARGELRRINVGGCTRLPRYEASEVEAFIRRNKTKPQRPMPPAVRIYGGKP